MAITDYASLQAAVSNWLHRSDLTAQIPDFIALAEARLSADLVARPMEISTTLTVTAGNAYVTLPSDMLEMTRLVLQSNPRLALKYASADELIADYPTDTPGQPVIFAVIGNQAQLAPVPDSGYTLELIYQQRIPALSNSSTTNWLITNWPNAYLYGALVAAQPFIVNDTRLPMFQQLYQQAVEGINGIDWYSGSTMTVRAR